MPRRYVRFNHVDEQPWHALIYIAEPDHRSPHSLFYEIGCGVVATDKPDQATLQPQIPPDGDFCTNCIRFPICQFCSLEPAGGVIVNALLYFKCRRWWTCFHCGFHQPLTV